MSRQSRAGAALLAMALTGLVVACDETRNVGVSVPHPLPVDVRNPVVLLNDCGHDNWEGEYAILLAHRGGLKLAGIVVDTSPNSPDLEANVAEWRAMVQAAAMSGIAGLPDPTSSVGPKLSRPADGQIGKTVPNRSEGARLIVQKAWELGYPYRPLAVVTGGRLTDVADAFLLDPRIADRIVVVSSIGTATNTGGQMGAPNGEMDPWADVIVTASLRFVQVSAYYDQTTDVPASRLSELPSDPFGAWIAAKQSKIWNLPQAADQVGILAVAVESFVQKMARVSPVLPPDAGVGPNLALADDGNAWIVTQAASAGATTLFWQLLR